MFGCQSELFSQFPALQKRHKRNPINKLAYEDRRIIADRMIGKARVLQRSLQSCNQGMRLEDEANRFANCGKRFIMWQCPEDKALYHTRLTCHSRGCEPCAIAAFKKIEGSLRTVIDPCFSKRRKGYTLALLTLTTNSARYGNKMPSRADISRLYSESTAFFKLHYGSYAARVTKSGKIIEDQGRYYQEHGQWHRRKGHTRVTKTGKTVKDFRRWRGAGFMSTIELGHNNNNLHIHALVYGPFIPIRRLVEDWKKLTGDSFIVDIRTVKNVSQAVYYVMKYITKPPVSDSYSDVADYLEMIKGSRRLRAGGIFFNRIKKLKVEKLPCVCVLCGRGLDNIGIFDLGPDQVASSPNLYDALRARAGPS